MKLRPIEDRVLIKPEAPTERSKSGLTIVMTDTATTQRGKIIAVGSGARLADGTIRPLDVSVGEIAVFLKSSATEISDGGEKYIVVREADIIFVQ